MASSPMQPLAKMGRIHFYWAERRWFTKPGVLLWTGKKHVRVLPMPKAGLWKAIRLYVFNLQGLTWTQCRLRTRVF